MRLIVTTTRKLVEYPGIPQAAYAILSHTWEDGEVTFQDLSYAPAASVGKRGWNKIEKACLTALEHGLSYIWIDTCCIDKTNSVELSEAINSMFYWYEQAQLCIIYLSDLEPSTGSPLRDLFECRWWQRGWTLQELIAPRNVDFYNCLWEREGSKLEWQSVIAAHTGIPPGVLLGQQSPRDVPIAQVISWAADRCTTRVEDASYCLLGLFDVNMPLLYGEGHKAFQRLQEELIKHKNDLTVLAHGYAPPRGSLFARYATNFESSGTIERCESDVVDFSLTNRGLRMSGDMPLQRGRVVMGDSWEDTYLLRLGYISSPGRRTEGGIGLVKVGPRLYCKSATIALAGFDTNKVIPQGAPIFHTTDYYILPQATAAIDRLRDSFTKYAIRVRDERTLAFAKDFVPHVLYDYNRKLCLVSNPSSQGVTDMVIAIKYLIDFAGTGLVNEFIVLCDRREIPPKALIFRTDQHPQAAALLFAEVYRENSIPWVLLEMQYPRLSEMTSSAVVCSREHGWWDYRASLKYIHANESPTSLPLYSLEFSATKDPSRP